MSNLWDGYIVQARESNHALRAKRLSAAGRKGSWRRWHRERQIVALLPMVERVAKNVRWMFAPHIAFADLTQAGAQGLVAASNTYNPAMSKGSFEPFAYFRVRGAIIDSQKRRVYKEEQHVSLDKTVSGGTNKTEQGGRKTLIDFMPDRKALPDADAAQEQIHRLLWEAIADLPQPERRVIECHLEGLSLTATAREVGLSLMWTRTKLAEARELVGAAVRGD
jgi:RNA polymerase sigma factor (sigma-70 family)